MTDKKKLSRNRSKVLDQNIIREHLKAKGIHTLDQFHDAFVIYFNIEGGESSIPRKAWYGSKIDNTKVLDVALFLGVNHYTELMTFSASMWWDELLANSSDHGSVFEIDYSSEDDDEWRNVEFKNVRPYYERQNLDEVPINQNWQLLFWGEPEDIFAAFLQSDKKITQIAPLKAQGCNCHIEPHAQAILFPQNDSLAFDKSEGTGWRRFIVIRSKYLPLQPRDPSNTTITAQELEIFARRLLDQKDKPVTVETYEFNLVEQVIESEMLNL